MTYHMATSHLSLDMTESPISTQVLPAVSEIALATDGVVPEIPTKTTSVLPAVTGLANVNETEDADAAVALPPCTGVARPVNSAANMDIACMVTLCTPRYLRLVP